MSNIAYNNNNPNDTCIFCLHTYSSRFSDDLHGVTSKDLKDIHTRCMYVNPVDGASVHVKALDLNHYQLNNSRR